MKRATRYIPILLLTALLSACGTTDYSTREPAPTLTVSLSATSCWLGASLTGRLTIAQRGTAETDYYALAAVVREGSVRIAVDDRELPATGEWVRLDGKNATIRIIPEQAGEHELTLQAMSAAGEVSEACRLTLTAEVGTELTAQAECEAEVLDPGVDAMIPIRLAIAKVGYAGPYKVTATLAQGAGAIYHEGNVITDVEVELAAETTLYFRPAALGEQLIAFTVTAEGVQTEARAYLNVAKKIEVHCAVGEGFTVSGTGTYNTEGSDLSLAFEPAEGYNFEVAGWYDAAGNLLSAEKICPIRLTLDGISHVELKLKKREVRIETTDCERIVTEYYVPSKTGNKLERQQAHDYRLRLVSDYRLSDDLVFAYGTYRYDLYPNQTVIDGRPSFIRGEAYPRFHTGETASDWFWRCDKRFAIMLCPSDNPQLRFDRSAHVVESESTRYLLPENITLKY